MSKRHALYWMGVASKMPPFAPPRIREREHVKVRCIRRKHKEQQACGRIAEPKAACVKNTLISLEHGNAMHPRARARGVSGERQRPNSLLPFVLLHFGSSLAQVFRFPIHKSSLTLSSSTDWKIVYWLKRRDTVLKEIPARTHCCWCLIIERDLFALVRTS